MLSIFNYGFHFYFGDMKDISESYKNSKFFVAIDGEKVVGCVGIEEVSYFHEKQVEEFKKFSNKLELKRMFVD